MSTKSSIAFYDVPGWGNLHLYSELCDDSGPIMRFSMNGLEATIPIGLLGALALHRGLADWHATLKRSVEITDAEIRAQCAEHDLLIRDVLPDVPPTTQEENEQMAMEWIAERDFLRARLTADEWANHGIELPK